MKELTFKLLIAGLMVISVMAMSQEKKMDKEKHTQMMDMMQDSTMMNTMMEHIAKDDQMRMKMMHKMMEACKSDQSKMMGMCKMMMGDEDMHSMMMEVMEANMKKQKSQSMTTPRIADKEVLIKFKPEAKETQIKSMASEIGIEQVKFIKELNLRVFKITSGKSVEEVIKHCQKEQFVEYAEANQTYQTRKK